MEQLVSTSQSEKRGEDRQEKVDYEFSGPRRSKKKNEVNRENEEKRKRRSPGGMKAKKSK